MGGSTLPKERQVKSMVLDRKFCRQASEAVAAQPWAGILSEPDQS